MVTQQEIREAIYKKYIVPTLARRERSIGVEIEMPIINLSGKPVEESVAHRLAAAFGKKFGFGVAARDADGNVYNLVDSASGDSLSFDCCYSNLELSMGKRKTIFEIKESFDKYYAYIQKYLKRCGYTLSGIGVNPGYDVNHNYPIPSERYRMLLHYLKSYRKHVGEGGRRFHKRPDFGTFTSASQVQLDVSKEELLDVLNVFGKLEPYKVFLFANSCSKEYPDLACSRNVFWEESMQGYNPRNLGLFDRTLRSIDELIDYIFETSIYCAERNGKYYDFTPVPVKDYFDLDRVDGLYYDGKRYRSGKIVPRLEDIKYHRTFKLEDLTFRGTVEFRSACCQPIHDSMTVAAFHTGLAEKVGELKKLLAKDKVAYGHGHDAFSLQHLFSRKELPSFVDRKKLREQLLKILRLAEEGLVKRGFGEEVFLKPLFDRAERLSNPALDMLKGLKEGKTLRDYVVAYGTL